MAFRVEVTPKPNRTPTQFLNGCYRSMPVKPDCAGACQCSFRHAKNIHLSDIEIVPAKDDLRPAFVVQDIQGADFFWIRAQHAPGAPVFSLKKVTDFSIAQSRQLQDTVLKEVDEKKL